MRLFRNTTGLLTAVLILGGLAAPGSERPNGLVTPGDAHAVARYCMRQVPTSHPTSPASIASAQTEAEEERQTPPANALVVFVPRTDAGLSRALLSRFVLESFRDMTSVRLLDSPRC